MLIIRWQGKTEFINREAWNESLRHWGLNLENYVRFISTDPFPWTYGERACVAQLCTGVARAASVNCVMEDYVTRRNHGPARSDAAGRADAFLVVEDMSYLLEAKAFTHSHESREDWGERAIHEFEAAEKQLNTLEDPANALASAVFVLPYLPARSRASRRDLINEICDTSFGIGQGWTGVRADLYYGALPEDFRESEDGYQQVGYGVLPGHLYQDDFDGEARYPGVTLLIRFKAQR